VELAHNCLHPSVWICVTELSEGIFRSFEKSEGLTGATSVLWLTVLKVFLISCDKRIRTDFHGLL